MVTGKARVARTRRINQSRFDQHLIEDYCLGEPPDPSERRVIRVVYGADRLTGDRARDGVSVIAPATDRDRFAEDRNDSVRAAAVALQPAKRDAPVTPPSMPSPPQPAEQLVPAAIRDDRPVPVTRDHRPAQHAPAPRAPARVTQPRQCTTDGMPPTQDRFELRRFIFGMTAGGIAGAILLAILSMI